MTRQTIQKLWRTARQLQDRTGKDGGFPPLLFLTDRHRVPDPARIVKDMPRGSAVILRDYDAPDRAQIATILANECSLSGVALLVAGDVRLANQVGAAGLHLPEYMLPKAPILRRQYPNAFISAACHSTRAIRIANRADLDAILISPVFPTNSHKGAQHLGVRKLAAMCRQSTAPAYALGGITPTNAKQLTPSGVAGIAAIGSFAAED